MGCRGLGPGGGRGGRWWGLKPDVILCYVVCDSYSWGGVLIHVLVDWYFLVVINFQVNMQDRFGQIMIQNLRVHVNSNLNFVVQSCTL